jgi:hypothetical protein
MNVVTTYNVKLVSFTNSVVLIIALLISFFTCASIFIPKGGLQNTGLSILLSAISLGFAWLMWQIFVIGRTRWTLDDNGLSMAWTKQFAFCNNSGIVIPWNEIKKISKGLDPNYYILKIDLTTGSTLRFIHDPMVTRDEFQVLIDAINEKHHLT